MTLYIDPACFVEDEETLEALAPVDPQQADLAPPDDAHVCTWCMGQGCLPRPHEQGWYRCEFCRGTGDDMPEMTTTPQPLEVDQFALRSALDLIVHNRDLELARYQLARAVEQQAGLESHSIQPLCACRGRCDHETAVTA